MTLSIPPNWVPDVFGGVSSDIEAAAPHASATQPRNLAQSGAAVGLDGTAAGETSSMLTGSGMAQLKIEAVVQIAICRIDRAASTMPTVAISLPVLARRA